MREVNADEVKSIVTSTNLTVVDCWAPWCGPCRTLTPRLEALSSDPELADVNFVAVNVDENPDFATQHGIKSIPTLIFYKAGQVINMSSGVPNERVLRSRITEHM